MTILCNTCDSYIEVSSTDRNCEGNYIFLCKPCIQSCKKDQSIISYASCKNKYSLNKEDLLVLKYVYIHNISNNIKYYLFTQVHQVIKDKYKNLDNFKKVVTRKQSYKEQKNIKRQYEIDIKTEEVNNILKAHNLSLSINDSDKYYKYIIANDYDKIVNIAIEEENENNKKQRRHDKLVKKLDKYQLPYNPNNLYCQKYINSKGEKLDEVIAHVALENYKHLIF